MMNPRALTFFNDGRTHFNNGKYALAIASYKQAIAMLPNDDLEKARCFSHLGDAHKAQSNLALALIDYNYALALLPNTDVDNRTLILQKRALFAFDQGQFDSAIKDLNSILSLKIIDEIRGIILRDRATVYRKQGKTHLALDDYNEAISIEPGEYSTHMDRGSLYLSLGQDKLALADYQKVMQLNPEAATKFEATELKKLFIGAPVFYDTVLKKLLSHSQRLSACYEGEINSDLTDPCNFQLFEQPVIQTCCGNTVDMGSLQKLQSPNCPLCRALMGQDYLSKTIPNKFAQSYIKDYVLKMENAERLRVGLLSLERFFTNMAKVLVPEEKVPAESYPPDEYREFPTLAQSSSSATTASEPQESEVSDAHQESPTLTQSSSPATTTSESPESAVSDEHQESPTFTQSSSSSTTASESRVGKPVNPNKKRQENWLEKYAASVRQAAAAKRQRNENQSKNAETSANHPGSKGSSFWSKSADDGKNNPHSDSDKRHKPF